MAQRLKYAITRSWPVTAGLDVAVDESGSIVLNVRPGLEQITLSDTRVIKDALNDARFFAAVVYPPPDPARSDLGPGSRVTAFDLLAGKYDEFTDLPAEQAARMVTEFLADFGYSRAPDMAVFLAGWYLGDVLASRIGWHGDD